MESILQEVSIHGNVIYYKGYAVGALNSAVPPSISEDFKNILNSNPEREILEIVQDRFEEEFKLDPLRVFRFLEIKKYIWKEA